MKIRTVKKITSGILGFILAFGSTLSVSAVVPSYYVPEIGELSPAGDVGVPRYIVGDVNGDGKVNITDFTLLNAHVKGVKPLDKNKYGRFVELRADNNFDGKINITDMVRLSAFIKGKK